MENLKKSALLTPELAAQAVEILRPSIETLIKNQNGRLVIYIVILDPVAAAKGVYEVLWEGPIGEANTDKWPKSYNEFAHAKTRVTFQTRLPSHLVRFHAPYMYQNGDFKFGGSDIRENLITGSSGLDWHHDYLVSATINATLHALCLGAIGTESSPLFIGQPAAEQK